MTDNLKIIPLGGMGEIGKNMTAYEYDGKIVVVDCGLAFPRDEMLGIDLVLPDITYLRERADDVLAFVITHGHEDHFGALPYVLRRVNAPVYGSRLTLAFAKSKLDEHGLLKDVETIDVTDESVIDLDPFTIRFVAVTHSVPDALSVVIETPVGRVVHSGDYKFDHTPIDGRTTDVNKLARLGQEGVLALLSDSTNVETEGSTGSESQVGQAFHRIFAEADGRVLVACFSSHIHRIQQAVEIAHLHGRKFAVSGRSMVKNVNIARNLGYLHVPDDAQIKLSEIDQYRPDELLILTTGSQGEPLSALSRMAWDDHPQVELQPGDTVVISARPVPGNEISVMDTVNRLLRSGATVIYGRDSGVHVSGHAAREDQRMLLNLLEPRFFVPAHGEYRHQYLHRELAREVGLTDERIFVLDNGDVLELSSEHAAVTDRVPAGMMFVDGLQIGGAEHVVLRDRQQLAGDGILIAVVTVSVQNGATVAPPELVARGFLYDEESETDLLDDARDELAARLAELTDEHVTGQRLLREDIHDTLASFIYRRTKREPLIMPVVVEV
ncbi:MAG TPA: ribonuclease J [Thermoleophilia bacterium]|nr:ribonuclease J [Thermoleophilia bacterium]